MNGTSTNSGVIDLGARYEKVDLEGSVENSANRNLGVLSIPPMTPYSPAPACSIASIPTSTISAGRPA